MSDQLATGEWHIRRTDRDRASLPLPERWISVLFNDFRYTVVDPVGRIVTCTATVWGGRRAIRKHIDSAKIPPLWESPIVYRERPQRDR